MSLLDDPGLGLPAAARRAASSDRPRVRFRPGSAFARELGLPDQAEGVDLGRYQAAGVEKLTVQGEGWFATEVPAGEVTAILPSDLAAG